MLLRLAPPPYDDIAEYVRVLGNDGLRADILKLKDLIRIQYPSKREHVPDFPVLVDETNDYYRYHHSCVSSEGRDQDCLLSDYEAASRVKELLERRAGLVRHGLSPGWLVGSRTDMPAALSRRRRQ